MSHVWISLPQDEDGYPPFTEEQLHVHEVAPGEYELDAPPAFAHGIAVGDVLGTQSMDDGTVWVTHVVQTGDHWCSRVVPLNSFSMDRVVEVFASMGVTARATDFGVATLDVGPEVDVAHVMAELEAGRAEGDWDFDLGVDPRA